MLICLFGFLFTGHSVYKMYLKILEDKIKREQAKNKFKEKKKTQTAVCNSVPENLAWEALPCSGPASVSVSLPAAQATRDTHSIP